MPPPIRTSFLKGLASPGDALWDKKSWTGLGDWRKIISTCAEVAACLGRGTERNQCKDPCNLQHAERTSVGGRGRKFAEMNGGRLI